MPSPTTPDATTPDATTPDAERTDDAPEAVEDSVRYTQAVMALKWVIGACLALHAIGQLLFWWLEIPPGLFR